MKSELENDGLNWENRTLCSDESCIGVIGPDGLCKECGKPFDGSEAENQGDEPYQADDGPRAHGPDPDEIDEEDALDEAAAPNGWDETERDDDVDDEALPDPLDWENRTLCSDESCIGVIGPDGRCKECGKPGA